MFNNKKIKRLEGIADAQFQAIDHLRNQLEAIKNHFGITIRYQPGTMGKLVAERNSLILGSINNSLSPMVKSFMVGCKDDCDKVTTKPIKKKKSNGR